MSTVPDVSVLMAVYNGGDGLASTLDTILTQTGVSLELVVVDDGSTDDSAAILSAYARRDERVRVLRQLNGGLTSALAAGGAAVRGRFIARHDVGDHSPPDRLAKQLACADAHPDAALVSVGTRYVGPRGEWLYEVVPTPGDAQAGLLTTELSRIRGPSHHGATLFPRHLYEEVGGYRRAFYYAQDLDLWTRLVERGRHVVLPEVLYEASITLGSISALHRHEQVATTSLILQCAGRRRAGVSETDLLERASTIRPTSGRRPSGLDRARALYFIGECLRRRQDPRSRAYFRQALASYPLHFKSLARLVSTGRI